MKVTKCSLFCQIFFIGLNFGCLSAKSTACDKSRKVLSGARGEITHLSENILSSNYTQVNIIKFE